GHDRPMNALLWELYGIGPHVDLVPQLQPESFQPVPTALERAERLGATVVRIGPAPPAGPGLTRALLPGGAHPGAHRDREGAYRGAYWDREVALAVAEGLATGPLPTVYAYHPDLDTAGHAKGPGSEAWLEQLARFDRLVEGLAASLRPGQRLFVTGDHGMVG